MRRLLRRSRTVQVALIVALALVTAVAVARVATADRAAPAGDRRPVVAFLGDSDTAGAGATSSRLRWTSLVSRAMGWREVNFGHRSTGYATSSTSRVCGQQICPPYGDLVDQVAAIDPRIVVIGGGQSDWLAWRDDPDGTTDAVTSLLDTMQQRLPDARIVLVGPAEPPGAAQAATVGEIADEVQQQARQRRLTYVDLLDPNVLQKGADVASNRFDPDDSGHRAIADRVLGVLR